MIKYNITFLGLLFFLKFASFSQECEQVLIDTFVVNYKIFENIQILNAKKIIRKHLKKNKILDLNPDSLEYLVVPELDFRNYPDSVFNNFNPSKIFCYLNPNLLYRSEIRIYKNKKYYGWIYEDEKILEINRDTILNQELYNVCCGYPIFKTLITHPYIIINSGKIEIIETNTTPPYYNSCYPSRDIIEIYNDFPLMPDCFYSGQKDNAWFRFKQKKMLSFLKNTFRKYFHLRSP